MSRTRIATFLVLFTAACTFPDRGNERNEATASAAPPPPPTITSAAPPPEPVPSAAPVATTPPAPTPAPAPAPKPVAVAAKPAPTGQTCRTTFTTKCTQVCYAKVDEKTTDPNKRRIEHDICLGECARASVKQCGSGP